MFVIFSRFDVRAKDDAVKNKTFLLFEFPIVEEYKVRVSFRFSTGLLHRILSKPNRSQPAKNPFEQLNLFL